MGTALEEASGCSSESGIMVGWMPVNGMSPKEAKAAAVFINSTAGRLQLMRHPGRKIPFPTYSTGEVGNIRIPNVKDDRMRRILVDCWERTKDMEVPQFRDGDVRSASFCGTRPSLRPWVGIRTNWPSCVSF